MKRLPILAVLAVVAAIMLVLRSHRVKSRVRSIFEGRPEYSDEAFGKAYFPGDQAEIAGRMRRILGQHVKMDLSRLGPDDHPIIDLEMEQLNRGSVYRFFLDLEYEFEVELEDDLLEDNVTVRTIVNAIAAARNDRTA